jgi:hypothetical protein
MINALIFSIDDDKNIMLYKVDTDELYISALFIWNHYGTIEDWYYDGLYKLFTGAWIPTNLVMKNIPKGYLVKYGNQEFTKWLEYARKTIKFFNLMDEVPTFIQIDSKIDTTSAIVKLKDLGNHTYSNKK